MSSFLDKIKAIIWPRYKEIQDEPPELEASNPVWNDYGMGARWLGAGSDGSKYPGGLSSSGASPILDHHLLMQNARSAYHDTVAAHAVVERFADTVIGHGLRLESTPDADILGITPEQAEEWSRNTEARFHSWARNKKCSRSENMNFYQKQRLAEVQRQRDGEYFVRFFRSKRSDLLNPLQIKFVDPAQIRGYASTSTYGFQTYEDGISRNDAGKEIAYQIYSFDKEKKTYKPVEIKANGPKSGLLQMLHSYEQQYADQGRGYTKQAHALQEFENLTDFVLAQIKKAINQSNIVGVVEPSLTEPASNPLEEITNAVAGPRVETMSPIPGLTSDEAAEFQFHPMAEATTQSPGSILIGSLQAGEKYKNAVNSAPSDSYRDFVEAFTSHISASMSMPGEVLMMKFGSSYSASRALLVMFWRIVEIGRMCHAIDFLNPTYEAWLEGEIAYGRISAPGWSDPRLREAWLCNNWIGDPMPNIDPMRTAKSDQIYATIGATTLNRIARTLNGSEAKANMATLTREYEDLPAAPWDPKQAEPMDENEGNPDDKTKKEDKE